MSTASRTDGCLIRGMAEYDSHAGLISNGKRSWRFGGLVVWG